jgi:hypothetical protein
MDYREANFRKKFADAARHFGVEPEQIVSLKVRDNVGSYSEYHRLLQDIEQEAGLRYTEIHGDLQGRGYLLADGENKVIVVEHETGLEILYVAGSVASLIGLIPLVLQYWRGHRSQHPVRHHIDTPVEIRRLDRNGHLHEDQASPLPAFLGTPVGFNTAISTLATLIESEMKHVVDVVEELTARVDELEKRLAVKSRKRKSPKSTKKKR